MCDYDFLYACFQESSIFELTDIFEVAKETYCEDTIKELRAALIRILRQEKKVGLKIKEVSPNGDNFVVVKKCCFVLVNIWGATILVNNGLLLEGELNVGNFQWFEKDNLVFFDLYYIVHDKWQKGICHFAHSGFKTYFTSICDAHKMDNFLFNDTFDLLQ